MAVGISALCLLLVDVRPAVALGPVDGSFGGNGSAMVPSTGTQTPEQGRVLVDAAGRIVQVTRTALPPPSPGAGQGPTVVRYLDDGTRDPAFGNQGVAVPAVPGAEAGAVDAALLPDDRVLVLATTSGPVGGATVLVRYRADGALDPTWGSGGVSTVPASVGVTSLALRSDGRVVVGGATSTGSGTRAALVWFTPDGVPDPGFGPSGVDAGPSDGSWAWITDLAADADGSVVAVGSSAQSPARFVAGRIAPDGAFGPVFAGSDAMWLISQSNSGLQVAIAADGKVVATGNVPVPPPDPSVTIERSALVRFERDGTRDPTFFTLDLAGAVLGTPECCFFASQGLVLGADGSAVSTGWIESLVIGAGVFWGGETTRVGPGGHVVGSSVSRLVDDYYETTADVALDGQGRVLVAGSAHGSGRGMLPLGQDVVFVSRLGAAVPPVVPPAPVVTATAAGTSATLTLAPRSSTGPAITGYRISAPDGRTIVVAGDAKTATIDGLPAGKTSMLTVRAVDVNGVGPRATVQVTVAAAPTTPAPTTAEPVPMTSSTAVPVAASAARAVDAMPALAG